MRRFFALVLAALTLLCSGHVHAKRKLNVVSTFFNGQLTPPSCDGLSEADPIKTLYGPAECTGLDASSSAKSFVFRYTLKRREGGPYTANASWAGECKAGTDAGQFYIPTKYVKFSNTDVVLQSIRDPMSLTGVLDGCKIKAVDVGGAVTARVPNTTDVGLKEENIFFQETGELGGSDDAPESDTPGYGGPGDGSGGIGGGDGGSGGGDGGTGGGDGGSGGGDGGSGGGDGGSGGGDGGSGGGDGGSGGDGGGGGGDQQQNCGAPGQPACKIDENGTPTGEGLFDELMKLVDGIGKDREKALDDLKSDEGKDTSLPFGFDVPRAACINPTVRVPGFAGSWEVDICKYVTLLGAMFEALWSALFVFAVMSLVARATSKPVA